MMTHWTVGACMGIGCVILSAAYPAHAVVLAEPGAASAVIVTTASATKPEQTAAEELRAYLSKVTGNVFAVVYESDAAANGTHIYVGPTAYAQQQGLDASKLGPEDGSSKRPATTWC